MSVPTTTSAEDIALTINLGPLTTTFTPAEKCASLTLALLAVTPSEYGWDRGYRCSPAGYLAMPDCYPTRYAMVNNNIQGVVGTDSVQPVFSPGSVCPSGYETRCFMIRTDPPLTSATVNGNAVPISKWTKLRHGETAIGCCPSGFICGKEPYSCTSYPPIGETISADFYHNCYVTGTRTTSNWVVKSGVGAGVNALQVIMVQGETATSTVSSATSSASTVSSGTGSDNDITQGLATGTKVALGVCIPLGVIIFALLGYIIIYRKNRQSKEAERQQDDSDDAVPGPRKGELEATTSENLLRVRGIQGGELDATESQTGARQNMAEANCPSELPAGPNATFQEFKSIAELSGDERHNQSRVFKTEQPGATPIVSRKPIQRRPVSGAIAHNPPAGTTESLYDNGLEHNLVSSTRDSESLNWDRGGLEK